MDTNSQIQRGSLLMAISGVAFIGYGLVFFVWNFVGGGFELGVATIGGATRADIRAFNPEVLHYISHLHVATAAFIISTGIAVAGLAWFGVREQRRWALTTAVSAAVIGLAIALPMHHLNLFDYQFLTHLGPVYLAAVVFVVGAWMAWKGFVEAGAEVAATSQQAT